jgi:hypothetical protein
MIPNFSLPATKTVEVAVANASDCLVLGNVHYERKYVDRSKDKPEPPMDFSQHAKPIRTREPDSSRSRPPIQDTNMSRSRPPIHDANRSRQRSFLSHLEEY